MTYIERVERDWRRRTLGTRLIRGIAERMAGVRPAQVLVSVIIPTWNRERVLGRAIESVLAQTHTNWESLVVDDGSTDGTRTLVARCLGDPRIRYLHQPHRNACAARNLALGQARGEIVAYLDSDNWWYPGNLTGVARAFAADRALQCVYTAQLVETSEPGSCFVRCEEFDAARLRAGNYIDVSAFSHRRRLYQHYGGFDESLERLGDWDLILRYTEREKTLRLPVLGSRYVDGTPDQLSRNHAFSYDAHLIRAKRAPALQAPLRVLYVLPRHPPAGESCVRTEIRAAGKLGVEVEAWSETGDACAGGVPVHGGGLRDAVARVRPDLVHVHRLDRAEKFRPEIEAAGMPITVRAHDADFSPGLAQQLAGESSVEAVYVSPHQAAGCDPRARKIRQLPVSFDPDLYFPAQRKDPKLVVAGGGTLTAENYATFLRTTRLCPGHRFVLVLYSGSECHLDDLVALRERLGSRVEVRSDVPHEELARLLSEAGIYLHTSSPEQPFGMPASIAEAMATGCRIVGWRRAGAAEYIGDAGALYESGEEGAARILETADWSEEDWKCARIRSIERAFAHFASTTVLETLVADWRRIAGKAYVRVPD